MLNATSSWDGGYDPESNEPWTKVANDPRTGKLLQTGTKPVPDCCPTVALGSIGWWSALGACIAPMRTSLAHFEASDSLQLQQIQSWRQSRCSDQSLKKVDQFSSCSGLSLNCSNCKS